MKDQEHVTEVVQLHMLNSKLMLENFELKRMLAKVCTTSVFNISKIKREAEEILYKYRDTYDDPVGIKK